MKIKDGATEAADDGPADLQAYCHIQAAGRSSLWVCARVVCGKATMVLVRLPTLGLSVTDDADLIGASAVIISRVNRK